MMAELQFLSRFQRSPNGVWACKESINVKGPSVVIGQGAGFGPEFCLWASISSHRLGKDRASARCSRHCHKLNP
jgi:hypothetical protein